MSRELDHSARAPNLDRGGADRRTAPSHLVRGEALRQAEAPVTGHHHAGHALAVNERGDDRRHVVGYAHPAGGSLDGITEHAGPHRAGMSTDQGVSMTPGATALTRRGALTCGYTCGRTRI